MSDNTAILAGFTQEFIVTGGGEDRHIFVKPNADTDSIFKAYDADNCEFINVIGWNVSFQRIIDTYPQ